MKKESTLLLIPVIATSLIYLTFSFIKWDFNVSNYSEELRIAMALLWFMIVALCFNVYFAPENK